MYTGALQSASNRATFRETLEIKDESDALVDLTDATIVFTIADKDTGAPALTASVGDGITIDSTGVFTVLFAESSMNALWPKTYNVGCTIQADDDEDVVQLIAGTISIVDGVVA